MDRYVFSRNCGAGAHSTVDAFEDLVYNKSVAIKTIFLDFDNEIPKTLFIEAYIMFALEHENIIRLERSFFNDNCIYLVMDLMSMSLFHHLSLYKQQYPEAAKGFLRQMLLGISYCHDNGIIHCDLSPENLLVDECTLVLKIADFGLARESIRSYLSDLISNPKVAALPYRAPELLLGSTICSGAIDIWSIGCIFASMMMTSKDSDSGDTDSGDTEDTDDPEDSDPGDTDDSEDSDPEFAQPEHISKDSVNSYIKTLFVGETETSILGDMFSKLGTPDEETWPGVSSLPGWAQGFVAYPSKDIGELVPTLGPHGVDLLTRLLCFDPMRRISARDALDHGYFL